MWNCGNNHSDREGSVRQTKPVKMYHNEVPVLLMCISGSYSQLVIQRFRNSAFSPARGHDNATAPKRSIIQLPGEREIEAEQGNQKPIEKNLCIKWNLHPGSVSSFRRILSASIKRERKICDDRQKETWKTAKLAGKIIPEMAEKLKIEAEHAREMTRRILPIAIVFYRFPAPFFFWFFIYTGLPAAFRALEIHFLIGLRFLGGRPRGLRVRMGTRRLPPDEWRRPWTRARAWSLITPLGDNRPEWTFNLA